MKATGGFYDAEIKSKLLPGTLFKAFEDAYDIIPKATSLVKSVEKIKDQPTIWLITYAEGQPFKSSKHRIDEIDKDNFKYSYTVIEGDSLADKFEKISTEFKLQAGPEGTSLLKFSSKYYTKDNYICTEEELENYKNQAVKLFTAVEKYINDKTEA